MVEKNLGKRIQEDRKARGLTQEKLAEMIDVSTNCLSALERGLYNISLEFTKTIMKLVF